MNAQIPARLLLLGLLLLPLAAGCAADTAVYDPGTGGPADSSSGLWTGLIAVLTFVVGFLVGATMSRNGGIRIGSHRHHHRRRTEAGWNRISLRIQDGTKQGLTEWRDAGHSGEADWDDLSRRIEERIIEEMHKHHD